MRIKKTNIRSLLKRIASLFVVVCMLCGLTVPLASVTAYAVAPTYYTDIAADSNAMVYINSSGSAEYFRFVPTCSGTYRFYSSDYTGDPYGALLDGSGNTLETSDDDGVSRNFSITYYCTAHATYYIKAYMWSGNTGSYVLNVEALELDCEHDYVLQSSTSADCDHDGVETYVCSLCGDIYSMTVESAFGHNYVDGICTRCGWLEAYYTPISEYNSHTGDVFLGGKYIELGISIHGSFGTSTYPSNPGFHSNGALGMIVDGDGWDEGELPTTGDFFLPDTPEERYIFSYYYNGVKYEYAVADRCGDMKGSWSVMPTVSNQSSGSTLKAVVYGVTQHNIGLEITYSFGVNDKNFKTEVRVINGSGLDITDVRFVRSFDPDQDDDIYDTNYTYNKVLANPDRTKPADDTNYAMVVARGYRTLDGFFFVAFDTRAYASQNVDFAPTTAYLDGLWEATHSFANYATEDSIAMTPSYTNGYSCEDTAIAITFNIGTVIASGQDSLEYYSSMSPNVENDLEEILPADAPIINSVNGAQISHGGVDEGPSVDVSAAEGHIVSYQWYVNDEHTNVGGTAVPGATSAHYTVPNQYAAGTVEYYYCVVTATRTDNGMHASTVSDPVEVEYLGNTHTFEETFREEATCTTDGLLIMTCPLCGNTEETVFPARGHDYVSGVCSRCGAAEPSADVWDGSIDASWYNSTDIEFTIYTAEQLAGLAFLVNNGNTFSEKTIYLGNDIDLAGLEWMPIGKGTQQNAECRIESLYFSGVFNGNYYTVSNISITQNNTSFNGLFGALKNATIECLAVENVYINQVTSYRSKCGGIAGIAQSSTIRNCGTDVILRGYATDYPASFGGLLGIAIGTSKIKNCFAVVDIIGGGHCAGLVGGVYSSDNLVIENCYAVGTIVETGLGDLSTTKVAGGLVAYESATIFNSFFSGTVEGSGAVYLYSEGGTITNCYHSSSTEMSLFQSQSWVETNLGWNFDTVWEFRAGSDYPVLQGFDDPTPPTPHIHDFEETSRIEPTCTVDGRINYVCSCGETKVGVIPAIGHNIETTVEAEVTCTSDGLIVDRCTNGDCNYEKRTVIHGEHHYSITDRQDAACETPGYVEYTCSNCGDQNYEYFDGKHDYVEYSRVEPQVDVEGYIIYTCTQCGDSYSVEIPALNPVLKNAAVLLIQNSLPWAEDVNTSLLETLKDRGVVSYYNIISSSAIASTDLTQYGVVFIANDQSSSMYSDLAANAEIIENYVRAGGNLIYGACDQGWGGGGSLAHALPGGVTTSNYYSVYNYIVNDLHPIVTGVYTDNRSLKDELLKGNYCSHTYFDRSTLPDGTNIILRDANGNPTLIEYSLGNGTVIASGLTWEYFYVRNHYDMVTNYSKYAYDDLVTYMVYMSNTCEHNYEMVEVVEATCEENGYTLYVCTVCSHEYKGNTVIALGHSYVETTRTEATCTTDGQLIMTCSLCGDTEETVFYAPGHNYVSGICSRCGAAESAADAWDGTTDTSWYQSEETEFTIYTAEQLAGLAYLVNNGNTFGGKTIYLGNDIDLAGLEWTPIGSSAVYDVVFRGTFDGAFHTIYGLKMTGLTAGCVGLFGKTQYATIQNLAIEEGYIAVEQDGNALAGILVGAMDQTVIDHVSVSGAISIRTVDDSACCVGLVVGYVESGGQSKVTNISATGTVEGYCYGFNSYVGGIIGAKNYGDGSLNIENAIFYGIISASDSGYYSCAGGILGVSCGGENIKNCIFIGEIYSDDTKDAVVDYFASTIYSNCYYYANFTSARGNATAISNFQSQSWVESYLGWDFDTVWEFGEGSDYPQLQGFKGPVVHTHAYEEISRTEPGCLTYGEVIYLCSCGETRTELLEPLQHDYQITNTQEPTCTEDGYIEFTCQNADCEATKRQMLERIGHDYGTDHICDRCGHEIEIHAHDYVANVVAPTCSTMGYTEYTCSCGHSYRDSYVEPSRHAWDDGEIQTAATCTTDGLVVYTCEGCGATKTTVIVAEHLWSEIVTVEKTCTTNGSVTKSCTVCCGVVEEIIPAGHDWDDGEIIVAATCETEGTKICTCSACGETQEFVIPALGHYYVNGICERCGEHFIDNIAPSSHPIYGMYFEIDDILSDYGPSLIDEYGLMLDYNDGAVFEKVAVFLTQDGTMWRRCIAVKGTNIEYATYVPYLSYKGDIKYTGLNHDLINIFRLSENNKGVWCYSDFATIGVNLQDAYGNLLLSLYDIGQAGVETRIFDDLDEMKAWLYDECAEHTPGDWIVDEEATCLPGSRHRECTVCGALLETEAIPPVAEHTASEWIVDVAPTSVQTGARHKECTVCQTVLESEVMPVLAKLIIDHVETEAGRTVRVSIDIQNNPGIIGAVLTIEYDPNLRLVGVEAGGAWSSLNFTRPATFSNPCNFVWDGVNVADFSDGSIIVLIFEVSADADAGAVYHIDASYRYGNMINADLEAVDVEIESGSITVANVFGDVNDDGVVDVADVIMLRRYLAGGYEVVIDELAADMNQDGYITVADVVLLRRHLIR